MPKILSYLATAGVCVLALSIFCQFLITDFYVADNFLAVLAFAALAVAALLYKRHDLAFSLALGGVTAWSMDMFVLPIQTLTPYPREYPAYLDTYGPVLPLAAGLVTVILVVILIWLVGLIRLRRSSV